MNKDLAIFFDGYAWLLMERVEGQYATIVNVAPTLDLALREAWMLTGAPVGIKLIAQS